MDVSDVNPIKKFEGLSRNQKLLVFGGAAALGGYLYYRSKSKAAEGEEGGEESSETSYEPNGLNGDEHGLGTVGNDEGIIPEGEDQGPAIEGGFGGTAPAGLSNGPTVTGADGTVPSIPTIGTVNGDVNAGGGTINQGEGVEHGENAPDVSAVTGGGAPVTPHASTAHLPKRKATHKKSPVKAHKTQKRAATHNKHKKTVSHHSATTTHHKPAHKAARKKRR